MAGGGAPPADGTAGVLVAASAVTLLGPADDVWRWRRVLVAGTGVAAACVVPYGETGVGTGLPAVAWVAAVAFGLRGLHHDDGPAGTAGVVAAFGWPPVRPSRRWAGSRE